MMIRPDVLNLDGVRVYVVPLLDDQVAIASLTAGDTAVAPSRLRERATEHALFDSLFGRERWTLGHTPEGAPVLTVGNSRPSLSVSHSRKHVAVALAEDASEPVGIDIEMPTGRLSRLTGGFLSDEEAERWSVSSDMLLRAWTAKEAAYKAMRGTPHSLRALRLAPPERSCPDSAEVFFDGCRTEITFHIYGGALIALARFRSN